MTLKYKRGQGFFLDGIVLIIGVVVFAFIAVILYPSFTDIRDDFISDPDINQTNVSVDAITDAHTQFPDLMDGIVITIMIFLAIGIAVTSFLIDSHPIFFVLAIMVMVIFLVIAGMFQEVWEEVSTDPELPDIATDFPITNFVMSNIPGILIAYMFLGIIALFAKVFRGGGGS